MKNTENADNPMSAMVYWPPQYGPSRRSGRPAQVSRNSRSRESRALTQPANRKPGKTASRNNRNARGGIRKSTTCGGSDSLAPDHMQPVARDSHLEPLHPGLMTGAVTPTGHGPASA